MSDHNGEQEMEQYLEGKSGISRAYRQQAREQTPEQLDDAILAASREALRSKPNFVFSPFSSAWQVPVSLAAVLVLTVALVFTLQDQTGAGRFQEPAAIYSDSDTTKLSGPESVVVNKGIETAGDATADLIRPEAEEFSVDGKRETVMMTNEFPAEPVSGQQEKSMTAPGPAEILDEGSVVSDADAEKAAPVQKDAPSKSSASMARMSKSRSYDTFLDSRVSILEEEISELRQSRQQLEKEKAVLERDMEQVEARRDVLERKMARIAGTESTDEEIHGTLAQVAWLTHIRNLRKHGQHKLALENFKDFRKDHPDYPKQQLERLFSGAFIREALEP